MIDLIENIHYCYPLEKQVLGAMILESSAFGKTYRIIDVEVFRNDSHREVYSILAEMWESHLPIDYMGVFLAIQKKRL
jgi:replicative DNA helicase